MKIAVISDIHGNMQALEAVVADIKKENCEKIFCLGDLAMAGPQPFETIERIQELENEFDMTIIQGNTDEMIAKCDNQILHLLEQNVPIMARALESDIVTVTDEQKKYLSELPAQKEIEIDDVKILLVHGSPRKNNENIYSNLPDGEIDAMMEGVTADLVLCGHTHVPCGYQLATRQTVVNVGSIGRPFSEIPQSCYVVLEINGDEFLITHKLVPYDVKKASQILEQRGFEGADKLAKMLICATSRYPQ